MKKTLYPIEVTMKVTQLAILIC